MRKMRKPINCLIPRLIIQPIVENAIFHGLEERLEGGRVTIAGDRYGEDSDHHRVRQRKGYQPGAA